MQNKIYVTDIDSCLQPSFIKSLCEEHGFLGCVSAGNGINKLRVTFKGEQEAVPFVDYIYGLSSWEEKVMSMKLYAEKGYKKVIISLGLNLFFLESNQKLYNEVKRIKENIPENIEVIFSVNSMDCLIHGKIRNSILSCLNGNDVGSVFLYASDELSFKENSYILSRFRKAFKGKIYLGLQEKQARYSKKYLSSGVSYLCIDHPYLMESLYVENKKQTVVPEEWDWREEIT